MGRNTYVVYVCDRCKHQYDTQSKEDSQSSDWGLIAYKQFNGSRGIGFVPIKPNEIADFAYVCPRCLNELDNWWKNENNPDK